MSRVLAVATCVALVWVSAADGQHQTLAEVLTALRENEALYDTLDVDTDFRYRLNPLPHHLSRAARTIEKRQRTIWQGKMHYYRSTERFSPLDGPASDFSLELGHDGESTRRFERQSLGTVDGPDAQLGHIADGPTFEHRLVPPHAMMFYALHLNFPLSTLLAGNSAIMADERAAKSGAFADFLIDPFFDGESEVAGLHCLQLGFWRYRRGQPETDREYHLVWLATDRNFFPVRHVAKIGSGSPYEIGSCESFAELVPGIWFPREVTATNYDVFFSRDAPVQWQCTWKTVSAKWSPSHEKRLFQAIVFPEGTRVTEVRNGEIVRSYMTPTRTRRTPRGTAVAVTLSLLGAIVVIAVALMRRRRRK